MEKVIIQNVKNYYQIIMDKNLNINLKYIIK